MVSLLRLLPFLPGILSFSLTWCLQDEVSSYILCLSVESYSFSYLFYGLASVILILSILGSVLRGFIIRIILFILGSFGVLTQGLAFLFLKNARTACIRNFSELIYDGTEFGFSIFYKPSLVEKIEYLLFLNYGEDISLSSETVSAIAEVANSFRDVAFFYGEWFYQACLEDLALWETSFLNQDFRWYDMGHWKFVLSNVYAVVTEPQMFRYFAFVVFALSVRKYFLELNIQRGFLFRSRAERKQFYLRKRIDQMYINARRLRLDDRPFWPKHVREWLRHKPLFTEKEWKTIIEKGLYVPPKEEDLRAYWEKLYGHEIPKPSVVDDPNSTASFYVPPESYKLPSDSSSDSSEFPHDELYYKCIPTPPESEDEYMSDASSTVHEVPSFVSLGVPPSESEDSEELILLRQEALRWNDRFEEVQDSASCSESELLLPPWAHTSPDIECADESMSPTVPVSDVADVPSDGGGIL
jgi:hypothetical protein